MKLMEDVLNRCEGEPVADVMVTMLALLAAISRHTDNEGKAILIARCLEAVLPDPSEPSKSAPPSPPPSGTTSLH